MKIATRLAVASAVFGMLSAGAHALTFTNITINNGGPSAGYTFIPTTGVPFGIQFQDPDQTVVGDSGLVTMSWNVHYDVTAGPGEVITGVELSPISEVVFGNLSLTVTHSGEALPYTETVTELSGLDANALHLSDAMFGLTPKASYHVDAVLSYTANDTNSSPEDAYASFTQLGLVYDTQAVPEPASMAALGLGVVGLIARRRKNSK